MLVNNFREFAEIDRGDGLQSCRVAEFAEFAEFAEATSSFSRSPSDADTEYGSSDVQMTTSEKSRLLCRQIPEQ